MQLVAGETPHRLNAQKHLLSVDQFDRETLFYLFGSSGTGKRNSNES